MKCKNMCKRFSACVDRDLTFAEEARLREHLRECPECASEFECFERMIGLLDDLPECDPGPDFYASVRRRIQAEGLKGEGELLPAGTWFDRANAWLRPALRPAVMRPAFGAAFFGLAIGLVVGTQAPQMARLVGAGPSSPEPATAVLAGNGGSEMRIPGDYSSPVSDIELAPLTAAADTIRLEGETEYVLERYLTDGQRGLVPADLHGQPVMDNQSDVFITF